MNTISSQPSNDLNLVRRRATIRKVLTACTIGGLVTLAALAFVTDSTALLILGLITIVLLSAGVSGLVVDGLMYAAGAYSAEVRQRIQAVLLEFDEPVRPTLDRLDKIKNRAGMAGMILGVLLAEFLAFTDVPARLMQILLGQIPGQHYLISPDSLYIVLPLVELAIFASILFSSLTVRMYAGPTWETWKRYERRRAAVGLELARTRPVAKGMRWFWWIAILLSGISLILFANSFSRVTDKGVYIHPTFSIAGRDYAWRDVRKMTWDYANYSVEFHDGYTWAIEARGKNAREIEKAMGYISQRSGIKTTHECHPGKDQR